MNFTNKQEVLCTQHAYSLEDVNIIQFAANNNLTIEKIKKNQEVIDNVRINDQEPLIQVYNQLQGIRPYYVFHDVDVDRYVIDGVYKQVFLSARELDQTKLNEQARTWVNQYLKYTHEFPKTKTIPGPNMIETKIDQDTIISSQLTLWSQMGSTVLRGIWQKA